MVGDCFIYALRASEAVARALPTLGGGLDSERDSEAGACAPPGPLGKQVLAFRLRTLSKRVVSLGSVSERVLAFLLLF